MLPALIALTLAQTLGIPDYTSEVPQDFDARPRVFRSSGRLGRWASSTYALLEFAPADGTGMGAACACAAVTGAKGETLTFSRASVGSCIKASTAALDVGDMVICASDQPRVMPGGDGTGALGLLVEGPGTNVVTRSEELDDAAWADYTAGGATAPGVTGDFNYSPTNTLTADWLQLPATSAAQSSGRSIAVLTAAAYSVQVYVSGGASWAADIDLCVETSGGATCTTCSYDSVWRPCSVQNVTSVAGGRVFVGNLSSLNGGTARNAADVLVWGVDAKLGDRVTSYVPTAGSSVVRAADTAALAVSISTESVSIAVTTVDTAIKPNAGWVTLLGSGTVHWGLVGYASNAINALYANTALGNIACSPAATARRWGWWDGTGSAVGCNASSTALGARTGAIGTATSVAIGDYVGAGGIATADGVYSRLCVDPSPTRCR